MLIASRSVRCRTSLLAVPLGTLPKLADGCVVCPAAKTGTISPSNTEPRMDSTDTLVALERLRARICFGSLPVICLPPLIKYYNVEHTGLKLTHILYLREAGIEA